MEEFSLDTVYEMCLGYETGRICKFKSASLFCYTPNKYPRKELKALKKFLYKNQFKKSIK